MDNASAQPGAHAPVAAPTATNGSSQFNYGSYGPPQGNIGQSQGPQPGYLPTPNHGGYGPPQGGYGPSQGAYGPSQAAGGPSQGAYGPPQGVGGPSPATFPPPQGNMYASGPPIFNQPPMAPGGGPPAGDWMMRPQNIPNCPPGLEYLTTIDSLVVNQKAEFLEALSGHETENQYIVTNSIGQKVYYAQEESDSCTRDICGSKRAFHMKILDNFGNQVINLNRPLACQACCFPCCLQSMEVTAPPGTPVGTIEQEWNLLYPMFVIKSTTGETILRIKGPFCTMNCYADVEFKVLSADGSLEVGKISKKWSGYAREASPKADVFGISFPMDLDVRMKAVMLGACFLIDMMYFEQSTTVNNRTDSNQPQNAPRQQQDIKPI